MEQRRFILFLGLSLAFMVAWGTVIRPLLFGPLPKKQNPPAEVAQNDPAEKDKPDNAEKKPDQKNQEDKTADADGKEPVADKADPKEKTEEPKEKPEEELPVHPKKIVHLGSTDPDSGYYVYVELTSRGAAVNYIQMNDPRYSTLDDRKVPLKVVGNDLDDPDEVKTFDLALATTENDEPELVEFKKGVAELHWELVETRSDDKNIPTGATFRLRSEAHGIELVKSYDIIKPKLISDEPHDGRDTQNEGYEVHFKLTAKNLSKKEKGLTYVLQGPVGVPLENEDHTRKFRDIKMGFLDPDEKNIPAGERSINSNSMLASAVVKDVDNKTVEEWKSPIKYIGVDNQYFAALVVPEEDQLKNQYIDSAVPVVVDKNITTPSHSDVSILLTSRSVKIDPGKEAVHEYALYAGPKRQDLLSPLGVEQALDFGWFGFVSKTILMIMSFLHNKLYIPYGIAIICVTVLVRGLMYPISRKQAMGAKKMKELQPQLAELKKKYANEKEKMAQAQMQLFRDNNYNPFAGCLPVFLQLPVFIGLYSALNNSVDLRMAKFLWVDNLAAPDALFHLPFKIPYLGSDFNLLPLVTVGLFLLQQKMFMPPATDPEQAMQQKMMNYMMIFMGFMFYHVPAGLCVYFIASSLWGITERKMLDIHKEPEKGNTPDAVLETSQGSGGSGKKGKKSPGPQNGRKVPEQEKPKGFFARIKEQALAAAEEANKQATLDKGASNKNRKNKGNKKR